MREQTDRLDDEPRVEQGILDGHVPWNGDDDQAGRPVKAGHARIEPVAGLPVRPVDAHQLQDGPAHPAVTFLER